VGHRELAEPGRERIGCRVLGSEFTRRDQVTVDGLGQRLPASCPVIELGPAIAQMPPGRRKALPRAERVLRGELSRP